MAEEGQWLVAVEQRIAPLLRAAGLGFGCLSCRLQVRGKVLERGALAGVLAGGGRANPPRTPGWWSSPSRSPKIREVSCLKHA